MRFTAPIGGLYEVSAQGVKAIATGKFETVKNPRRKWFQFWKPKFITREIYDYVKIPNAGRKTVFLKAGDVVDTEHLYRL